jgi:hypothetical protein
VGEGEGKFVSRDRSASYLRERRNQQPPLDLLVARDVPVPARLLSNDRPFGDGQRMLVRCLWYFRANGPWTCSASAPKNAMGANRRLCCRSAVLTRIL